ncbi:hypothetical protein UFOVP182_18 [uncultured Caudovirales phage]|uniref:Uncharacterized protein n=1 Tax=uncultured Caudovirales phage TaxID=2100421 RepID=A0A6J7WCZ0_9CAUD|nr:hypothetical protein UFOVP182_18 [uncultured Caudovirales phage]
MIETKLKVIQPNNYILPDIYFKDSTQWTLTKSNGNTTWNKAFFTNNDLHLKVGIKTSSSNWAKAVANGVVLDTTKTYVMTIKLNYKNIEASSFKIGGVDFSSLTTGKEITRKFKPLNNTLDLRIDLLVPKNGNGIGVLMGTQEVVIDYIKIIEYDVMYLDLLKTEPVLYQSNVKDIYEPDKIKSDYTKDFDIPGTPNNNRFFNHWYKVSAKGEFDVSAKTPVIIQRKETDLIEGYMTLNSVKITKSLVTYNVNIVAEMSNIWVDIDTKKLSDLPLSEYNHEMNMYKMFVDLPQHGTVSCGASSNPTAINTAWTYETKKTATSVDSLTLPNGSMRLRMFVAGHGYKEGDYARITNSIPTGTQINIPCFNNIDCIIEAVLGTDSFYVNVDPTQAKIPTNTIFYIQKKNFSGNGWFYGTINRGHTTTNTMTPTKVRPQLFMKGLIDKIFKQAGYEYESEFFNTNYFKSLCVDILTKELTQSSESMGDNFCEVQSKLTGHINPITGQPDPVRFLKYAKLVPQLGVPYFPYNTKGDSVPYGTEYSYDIEFNNVMNDGVNLFGTANSTFNPKVSGDYAFSIQLSLGCTIVNNSPDSQYVLPEKQKFKQSKYCTLCPFDFDFDGKPSNSLYVYNNADAQTNSGIIFKIQVVDQNDKVLWTSARSTAAVSNRGLGGYQYTDVVIDVNQQVALPLDKGNSYKLRLIYTRNQKYCLGTEPNATQPWRYGTGGHTTDVLGNSVYYTKANSPNTFGSNNFSVWMVGNLESTDLVTGNPNGGQIWGGKKTGSYYCKFELLKGIAEGSDVFIKNFIADMEQKDFLAAINKMFNLYWYWDRNNKKYKIEPFYGFYNETEIDWTNKVDTGKEIEMKPLDNDKKYILKYKDAGDYYNDDYRKAFGNGYGDSIIVNSSEIATTENTMECGFSLGVLVGFPKKPYNKLVMPTYTNAALTINNSDNNDNSENIRVYICGGYKYTPNPLKLDSGNKDKKQFYDGVSYDHFPYVGHIDDTYAPYYDLCFSNPAQFSYIATNYTTHNLYNKFWRDWFNLILNKEQKLVSYYINLNDSDIFNLDYSKRYVINKEPFRLISVADHNLTANNIALVTFVKDFGSKQFVPKTIVNTGGTTPWWRNRQIIWEQEPWSVANPFIFGGYNEFNPGSSDYNAVISHSVQSSMWSQDFSMSDGSTTYGTNLNNGGAVSFQSINLGTFNKDFGSQNFVTGNNNQVYASNAIVSGINNQIYAQNTIVLGNNIIARDPGIYFGNVFIDPLGTIHNATNVINGGGDTTGYYESVNNLYKPNVIGLISGSGSTTNKFAGVLNIDNPNIQFSRVVGYDRMYDSIRNY